MYKLTNKHRSINSIFLKLINSFLINCFLNCVFKLHRNIRAN